jgi:hypothetical protein
MVVPGQKITRFKVVIYVSIAVLILAAAALILARQLSGRGLGLRSLPRSIISVVKAVNDQEMVTSTSQGDFTNIIFLHHSTGNKLIEQGGVRERFTDAGYHFWDHSYNNQGLRDPSGNLTGYSYIVPRDNTDPDGLARIFSQPLRNLPINTLSGLFQHEVIIFKSCFTPTNHIGSDKQLEQYKAWYLEMREVMDSHPEKIFIVLTAPPLNPAETNPEEARRARDFADWLKSDEFLAGYSNIFTFDFFNYLAEENSSLEDYNMLRAEYRNEADSHPNQLANQTIGPLFVEFVIEKIQNYLGEISSRSLVYRTSNGR